MQIGGKINISTRPRRADTWGSEWGLGRVPKCPENENPERVGLTSFPIIDITRMADEGVALEKIVLEFCGLHAF